MIPTSHRTRQRRMNRAVSATQRSSLRARLHIERLESRAVLAAAFLDLPGTIDGNLVAIVADESSTALAPLTNDVAQPSHLEPVHAESDSMIAGSLLRPSDARMVFLPQGTATHTSAATSSLPCDSLQSILGHATIIVPLDAPHDLQAALTGAFPNSNCVGTSNELPNTDSTGVNPDKDVDTTDGISNIPLPGVLGANDPSMNFGRGSTHFDLLLVDGQPEHGVYRQVVGPIGLLSAPVPPSSSVSSPLDLRQPLYEAPPAMVLRPASISAPSTITSSGIDLATSSARPEPSVAAIDKYFAAMRAVPIGTSSMRVDAQRDTVVTQPLVHGGVEGWSRAAHVASDTMSSLQAIAQVSSDRVPVMEVITASGTQPVNATSTTFRLPENPFRRVVFDASTSDGRPARLLDQRSVRRAAKSVPMSEELWKSMIALGAGICIYCQHGGSARREEEESNDGNSARNGSSADRRRS